MFRGREMGFDLWIFGAMEVELDLVIQELDAEPWKEIDGSYEAQLNKWRIGIASVGVGIPSSCLNIGRILGRFPSPRAIMVGSCGALPESGLELGDLVIGECEIISELGLVREKGIGDSSPLGHLGLQQELPMSHGLAMELFSAASIIGRTRKGRLLTVLGASCDGTVAKERALRFKALAENMEGYCLALAGKSMGIEVGELRGVSNEAGDRNQEGWHLEEAQALAQRAVLEYMRRSN